MIVYHFGICMGGTSPNWLLGFALAMASLAAPVVAICYLIANSKRSSMWAMVAVVNALFVGVAMLPPNFIAATFSYPEAKTLHQILITLGLLVVLLVLIQAYLTRSSDVMMPKEARRVQLWIVSPIAISLLSWLFLGFNVSFLIS